MAINQEKRKPFWKSNAIIMMDFNLHSDWGKLNWEQ